MAEVTVEECEDYVQEHQIQPLLKTAIEALCKDRPKNPIKFLKNYFDRLDREKVSGLPYPAASKRWLPFRSDLAG